MKNFILFLLFLSTLSLAAQDATFSTKENDLKLSALPYYNFGRG